MKKCSAFLQASQASATDLRLWCAYVHLLVVLERRQEAVKVAEKALSMVQVDRSTIYASCGPSDAIHIVSSMVHGIVLSDLRPSSVRCHVL